MFKKNKRPSWTLASPDLKEPFTDFMLSRQAMNCTAATLEWYRYTAGVFLVWCEKQGVSSTDQIKARHVRQYIRSSSVPDANRQKIYQRWVHPNLPPPDDTDGNIS